MPRKIFSSLLTILKFNLVLSAQEASIQVPPTSVNITLNGVASFSCTAIATYIQWKANGQPIETASKGFDDSTVVKLINETSSLRMATLKVVGSPDTNNVSVVCVAYLLSSSTIHFDKSKAALILVQGRLGPVSNFNVTTINSTTVNISWSPPFTLEGVPILGYNVTITNTTSGENETMSVEDTTLLYSIDHPNPENYFTVTVVPLNEVGAGAYITSEFFFFPLLLEISSPPAPIITSSVLMMHTSSTPFMYTDDKAHLSAIAVIVAVVATPVIFFLIFIITLTAFTIKQTFRASATVQDVLETCDNPAYEVVKKKTFELQKNSAYDAVALHQKDICVN